MNIERLKMYKKELQKSNKEDKELIIIKNNSIDNQTVEAVKNVEKIIIDLKRKIIDSGRDYNKLEILFNLTHFYAEDYDDKVNEWMHEYCYFRQLDIMLRQNGNYSLENHIKIDKKIRSLLNVLGNNRKKCTLPDIGRIDLRTDIIIDDKKLNIKYDSYSKIINIPLFNFYLKKLGYDSLIKETYNCNNPQMLKVIVDFTKNYQDSKTYSL